MARHHDILCGIFDDRAFVKSDLFAMDAVLAVESFGSRSCVSSSAVHIKEIEE